jgi:MazG family protein
MTSDSNQTAGEKFQHLVEIMAQLRSPEGCPWDRAQDFDAIKAYLLEETYEVLEAVEARDWGALVEELGDLMLQAVFFAQLASEQKRFSIGDCLDAIVGKLVRRHPHVFGTGEAKTPDEVRQRWDEIKQAEREERRKPGEKEALLDAVPRNLPALMEAQQLTSRAARVGFDWQNADQVLAKLEEELKELSQARTSGSVKEVEREIGDLLFVIVNLARFFKVDAEQALRGTNRRFRERFGYVESKLAEGGRALGKATLEEMDRLWDEAKRTT